MDDPPPAFPAPALLLLVGDSALPYGRETALLSRDRWARCRCREIPPEPEPPFEEEEGGGQGDIIVAEALLCRCLSTMVVGLCVCDILQKYKV